MLASNLLDCWKDSSKKSRVDVVWVVFEGTIEIGVIVVCDLE